MDSGSSRHDVLDPNLYGLIASIDDRHPVEDAVEARESGRRCRVAGKVRVVDRSLIGHNCSFIELSSTSGC